MKRFTVILLCLLVAGCMKPVNLGPLAGEVQIAEAEARVALVGSDLEAVVRELSDSTAVLLQVYDPNRAYLDGQARALIAEIIAIAEADYADCVAGDPNTCREGLLETHWWLQWLLFTDVEEDMP